MLRLPFALALGAASSACAFAAVGWVLYAGHPGALWAAQCFAAWGALSGLACGVLHLRAHGRPAHAPPALPADELAGLVRAAIARAASERQARPGSAADRAAPVAASLSDATSAPPAPPAPSAPAASPALPVPAALPAREAVEEVVS
jgi:hypothetical protein